MGPIRKGSAFRWSGGLYPQPVRCIVNRVAPDGSWADFTMSCGGSSWGKRMTLPLPKTFVRVS